MQVTVRVRAVLESPTQNGSQSPRPSVVGSLTFVTSNESFLATLPARSGTVSPVVVSAVSRASCALLLALLAACTFDGQFASDYRCGVGGTCPSGSRCVADRCTLEDDVDGGGGGGDGGAGDIDAMPLGSDAAVARFADDFGDGVLTDWRPWTYPGCSVAETGGALQLDYLAGTAYCGADTADSFDLRTGAVMVEVVETPALANFEAYLILFSGGSQQQILMIRDGGDLTMQLRINGSVRGSLTIADPGDRFWRVHEEGSTTIWETSVDGASWSNRHTTTVAVDASAMSVELAAGSYGPGINSAARVRFDGLRIE